MTTPLHQMKAEFFKTLAHPIRIRALELLSAGDRTVAEMLTEIGVEPSHLSQQLAVLRRSGLVTATRHASVVTYSLTSPQVADLLAVARRILTTMLSDQIELLSDLQAETAPSSRAPKRRSQRR